MDRISHKAGRAAFGLSCVARFEQLACVFASCGALHYAKILASLKYTSHVANGLTVSLARGGGWETLGRLFSCRRRWIGSFVGYTWHKAGRAAT